MPIPIGLEGRNFEKTVTAYIDSKLFPTRDLKPAKIQTPNRPAVVQTRSSRLTTLLWLPPASRFASGADVGTRGAAIPPPSSHVPWGQIAGGDPWGSAQRVDQVIRQFKITRLLTAQRSLMLILRRSRRRRSAASITKSRCSRRIFVLLRI